MWATTGATAPDVLWRRRRPQRHPLVRHADRRFTSRRPPSTSATPGPRRCAPRRWPTSTTPSGFVAHAFGAIDGHAYNSLEGVPAQLRARLPGLRDRPGPPGRRHRPGRPPRPGGQLRPRQAVQEATWADLAGTATWTGTRSCRNWSGCCASTPTPTSSSTPSGRGWRSTGPSCARRRSGACASASSRTSRTGPTASAPPTRSRTTWSPCTTPRPRTGTTTRWRSTSPAATGPRP